ncbi:MAG TPA: hypothetical protein VJV79_07735 [Polyangiaceae bacterium]|nr:hypothetical protein [Polyangiaceae bacterium]
MRGSILATLIVVSVSVLSGRALAYHETGSEWVRGSPYTLSAGELSLGVVDWDVGITDEVTVGTHPVLWAVGPWSGKPVPNAKLKLRDWVHGRLALSIMESFAYLNGSKLATDLIDQDTEARLLVLDTRFDAAFRADEVRSIGMSLDFTYASVSGSGVNAALGNAEQDALRLTAWGEWRFSRVVALKLNGRVLLHSSPPTGGLQFHATPSVAVDARVSFANVAPAGAWAVWPELELSWKHVNLMLGVGYGYQAVPIVDVTLDRRGILLTGDFFVRFGG